MSAPRAPDQGGIHWYSVWLFSADKSQSAILKADGLLTLASSSMVPSWWPLLLLPDLLGLVSSKSGGKISLSQSWEKTHFQYEFSIDSLGPPSKRELELFNLSFSAGCPFDWVQRRLSHSSNYRWGSTVNWNISQHSNADGCNIAQVLIYGCWTTSSELSGLSQADKVSLLQGVLKTQVQEV